MVEETKTGAPAYEIGKHPDLTPPLTTVGVIGWMRSNLFPSPLNAFFTVAALYLLYLLVPPFVNWALIDADWVGENRDACSREGACWVFIVVWFKQIMYGRFPDAELWRINLSYVVLVGAAIPLFIPGFRWKHWIAVFLLLGYPFMALYLFAGMSEKNVDAWPYRLMTLFALALAAMAYLPVLEMLRERSGAISVALLILFPVWGLSAPSTWSAGFFHGAPVWISILTFLLVMAPPIAVAAALMHPRWRPLVAGKMPLLCAAAAILALIGLSLPAFAWDEAAGPSPPGAVVLTMALIGLAALCPWGYGNEAGRPGRLAWLLLPAYLLIALLVMVGPPAFLTLDALDWTHNTRPFFAGFGAVLPVVETPLWGGLFLTLVVALTGIVASLPIGIVLALGRRSNMPLVRAICVAFIELWRGVPLITVLFMSSVMFPLFMPEGMTFDKLLRALIGVMLFSAAYMAEVVRGGLQAIPKGQYEAAQALGLGFWKVMALIVLPQALKLVIPGIVNTFIGLFKDTTLVLIIGLFDLLGMVQAAGTNQKWLGFSTEGYVFAGFVFWGFCFGMSRYSQHLERKLHTGH